MITLLAPLIPGVLNSILNIKLRNISYPTTMRRGGSCGAAGRFALGRMMTQLGVRMIWFVQPEPAMMTMLGIMFRWLKMEPPEYIYILTEFWPAQILL